MVVGFLDIVNTIQTNMSQGLFLCIFSEGSFNKMLADCSNHLNSNHLNLNNNCANLALLHLNIRSISKKLDKFSIFLGSLALDFSFIGIKRHG